MANPGSDQARKLAAMSRRAADLSSAKALPPKIEAQALVDAELRLNMRCGGCKERIGVGLVFSRFEVGATEEGRPVVNRMRMGACNGSNGCDFAAKARKGADVVEMVEYVWLTGDAPVGAGDLSADVQAAAEAAAEDEAFADAERLNGSG
jgi:hypothetical protein